MELSMLATLEWITEETGKRKDGTTTTTHARGTKQDDDEGANDESNELDTTIPDDAKIEPDDEDWLRSNRSRQCHVRQ